MNENKEYFIKALRSTNREGIDKLISCLEYETDFFTAPASTKYHLAYEGGLLEHSLNVLNMLKEECLDITELSSESIVLVSLLHDVCKANYYKKDYRNVKVDGTWKQVECYTVDDQVPLGHGEKSVIILQNYINLTLEEAMAIRWHMGGFETKENYNCVNKAFNEYKLAFLLHIADMKATYLLENKKEG